MDWAASVVTALVTLGAVLLGGWLTLRTQERLWQRDHARQWRDIRLNTYGDFLAAVRKYVAFVSEPATRVEAVPHPRRPGVLMPLFDKDGRSYREQLEAATSKIRLVSQRSSTVDSAKQLAATARRVATARAAYDAGSIPPEIFDDLFAGQDEFVAQARQELGLPASDPAPGELSF